MILKRHVVARWLAALFIFGAATAVWAAEVIPPKPQKYFNDYAGVVSASIAETLNARLEDFEKKTSSQIVVVVYPKMQSDSSIEDYTVRIAQAWQVGQKGKNNGAVLFVFIQNRTMYIQVGYGLEGAIPDATAKTIIEREIKPGFRAGNYGAGLSAGVDALMKAAAGEYKGTGRTVNQQQRRRGGGSPIILFLALFILVIALSRRRARGGRVYTGMGPRTWGGWSGGGWTSGGGSGGGWSSGGGSSGGFSSGGGSFGGGGAGGSW